MRILKNCLCAILAMTVFSCIPKQGNYINPETRCHVNNTGTGCFTNTTSKEIVVKILSTEQTQYVAPRETQCIPGIPAGVRQWIAQRVKGRKKWDGVIKIRQCDDSPILITE